MGDIELDGDVFEVIAPPVLARERLVVEGVVCMPIPGWVPVAPVEDMEPVVMAGSVGDIDPLPVEPIAPAGVPIAPPAEPPVVPPAALPAD